MTVMLSREFTLSLPNGKHLAGRERRRSGHPTRPFDKLRVTSALPDSGEC